MNIKEALIKELNIDGLTTLDINEVPEDFEGDYSIPCFKFAKELKKAPNMIASELVNNIKTGELIEKVGAVGPYINITLNREYVAKMVVQNILNGHFGETSEGNGKTICIDYSSITLSKQVHIGHLCTTVIGECLARIYENFGYKVVRMNYLGDMGTPFGKIITMFKREGNKNDVEEKGAAEIQRLYARFSSLEKEDPSLIDEARNWGLRIDKGDKEATELCEWFKKIALDEAKEMYTKLGIEFDDYRGEAYYNTKTDKVVKLLEEKNLLVESEGAKCVDLSAFDMGMYLVLRGDGATLYSTRDLAAAIDRAEEYKFDKCLYVTDVAQKLHFASWFKVLDLLGFEWAKDLEHVYYGRLSTTEGRISGREGHTPIMKDIFEAAISKSKSILEGRGLSEEVAEAIGVSAVVFSVLKTERIKDGVFSLDQAISFEGNSSVYLQYTDVRIKKIFKGHEFSNNVNLGKLGTNEENELLIKLDKFPLVVRSALVGHEPSEIVRYALELCAIINRFYNNNKIMCEDAELSEARKMLCKAASIVLEKSMYLLGVKVVDEM